MFRIRIPSGEQAIYRSADELVKGVRSGLIGPGATILHQASGKWLPIESHPHYKKAREVAGVAPRAPARGVASRPGAQLELGVKPPATGGKNRPGDAPTREPARPQAPAQTPSAAAPRKLRLVRPQQPVAARTAKPLAAPSPGVSATRPPRGPAPRPGQTPPSSGPPARARPNAVPELGLESLTETARRADPPAAVAPAPASPPRATNSAGDPDGPVRRPLLTEEEATGMQFVESLKAAARNPRVTRAPSRKKAQPIMVFGHRPVLIGIAAMLLLALGRWVGVAATTSATGHMEAGMAPPLTPVSAEEAAALAARERPGSSAPTGAAPVDVEPTTYQDAYAAAQGDLLQGFRLIPFDGLFSPGRLASPDSLRSTRRDIAAALNAVAVYRSQEVRLDAIYERPRPSLREGYATVQVVDSVFTMLDSVYTVLLEAEDAYRMSSGAITFESSAAARRYGRYRVWLHSRLGRWADRPSDTVPFTIRAVLRATAGGSLPHVR